MADTASVISEPSYTPHPDKILKFKLKKKYFLYSIYITTK